MNASIAITFLKNCNVTGNYDTNKKLMLIFITQNR